MKSLSHFACHIISCIAIFFAYFTDVKTRWSYEIKSIIFIIKYDEVKIELGNDDLCKSYYEEEPCERWVCIYYMDTKQFQKTVPFSLWVSSNMLKIYLTFTLSTMVTLLVAKQAQY